MSICHSLRSAVTVGYGKQARNLVLFLFHFSIGFRWRLSKSSVLSLKRFPLFFFSLSFLLSYYILPSAPFRLLGKKIHPSQWESFTPNIFQSLFTFCRSKSFILYSNGSVSRAFSLILIGCVVHIHEETKYCSS